MQTRHFAIDGSVVQIDGDGDLQARSTATGWAVAPTLMRSHPFMATPPGHLEAMEAAARSFDKLKVHRREAYSLKGGTLHVAEVELPSATKTTRRLTLGIWASEDGCLTTSIRGWDLKRVVEVFDGLDFRARRGGVTISSPVVARPRVPEVAQYVPGVGVLTVKPAIPSELDRVPRSRGFPTDSGELFRLRAGSAALLYVSPTVVATVTPEAGAKADALVAFARTLRAEWAPQRGSACGPSSAAR